MVIFIGLFACILHSFHTQPVPLSAGPHAGMLLTVLPIFCSPTRSNASHSFRRKPFNISSQKSSSRTCISFLRIHLRFIWAYVTMILCFIINVCIFSFLPDNYLLWAGQMLISKFWSLFVKWRKVIKLANIKDKGSYQRSILMPCSYCFQLFVSETIQC